MTFGNTLKGDRTGRTSDFPMQRIVVAFLRST
jgi:hypothetical protein